MRRHLLAVSLFAALMGLPTLTSAQGEEPPYGTYTYVKGMRGDQEIPKENLEGNTVKIEDGKVTLVGPDGQVQFEITYTIDEEGEREATFTLEIVESALEEAVGSKAKGRAKIGDDGTITLIYDYQNETHPADYEPDGPSQHLFVLKKTDA